MNKDILVGLEEKIHKLLIENPNTRDDDMVLYFHYVLSEWMKSDTNKPFELVFVDVFRNANNTRKDFNVCPFCSVERVRRKVQEKFPNLKGSNDEKRKDLIEEYKEYSRT